MSDTEKETKEARETKELKVGEHTLVVHTYVTGRDLRRFDVKSVEALKLVGKDGEKEVAGLRGDILIERQDMQIEAVVLSVDGNTENVIDAVLDLPGPQSTEIMQYIESIVEPKKEQADS